MSISFGIVVGVVAWFVVRYLLAGLYTVDQNERAVKTVLGRAQRLGGETTLDDPISQNLRPDERERYRYPQLRVIPPGGPVLQMAVGAGPQDFDRHADAEHGLRSRGAASQ